LFRLRNYDQLLVLIFVLTLPLINPWVRGDGVGYYAYARSLLIEHRLNFEKDWLASNTSFRMGRVDADGRLLAGQYTKTGHLDNHFAIGTAILWSPFLVFAHVATLTYDRLGGHVPLDGFSRPYMLAMALATALYGFLALWISFRLARKYLPERWAFLATLGIWFGSSLPVYMYFNPSWPHAPSAFSVALFLWYWERTRPERNFKQWVLLGIISASMVNVYYPNAILLLLPLVESLVKYGEFVGKMPRDWRAAGRLFLANSSYLLTFLAGLIPTLLTRKIIYGNPFTMGDYSAMQWNWTSPVLLQVLFSAQHGLLSWTPILILSLVGLVLFPLRNRALAGYLLLGFFAFYLVIACYPDWHGVSSFGNRFFVSLTCFFIMGLAAFFDWLERGWKERRVVVLARSATAILIVWNLGLIFQWGMHLIPARGPISWREVAYNQVAVVPWQATRTIENYLMRRKQLMGHIEDEDVKQLKSRQSEGSE
jgi:Dolichyl-phosphate-mannose-protein mannosyltransferase